jgi:hypothetical protein
MNVLSLRIDRIINKLLLFCFALLNGTVGFGQVNTYNTVGTSTLTVPAGATFATIECLGGGGGGGTVTNGTDAFGNPTVASGGGGGGGAYSKVVIPVIPGNVMEITVGAGGSGNGTNYEDGLPGRQSKVVYNSNIICSADGGFGGGGAGGQINGIGGTGGYSGIGFLYKGGSGANGNYTSNRGGGGGGSAGSASNGSNASGQTGGAAGGGFSSGSGGNGGPWNGANGGIYGSGGGGGSGASYNRGGNGAQGRVVVTFCSNTITTQPSTAPQNICSIGGASTTLTVAATGATSFQWYSNNTSSNSLLTATAVGTGASYTPPTATAGVKYYFCVATWADGCTAISNVSGGVFVGSPVLSNGSSLICNNGSVVLDASALGATSYSWSPATGLSGTSTASVTANPTVTTTYTVITSGGTCGSTSSSVTVNPAITFSATVTSENLNGYTIDAGEILNLNAYPIQNNIMINGLNNSYTGSLGGTWTASTVNAGSTCGGQNATLSFVTTNTYLGSTVNITPQEGTHMLRFNSGFTDAGGLGYVTSPSFSTVGYTGMIIDFWFLQFVNSSAGENVSVEYRIGAGAWTAMTSNILRAGNSTKCPSWMNISQEFPLAMMGQPAVQVRFRFYSGGCAGQQMLLDNIRISGVTAPGGYSYYSNYLWTSTVTGASANIVNPLIRSTTTTDINRPNTAGSILFNVQLTDGAGCVYNASDGVNINPSASGNVIAAATASPQVICSTPGTSNLSTLTGTGPATIQWEQSTVGPSGPWTDVPGATTIDFTATGITQTTWYRIKPSSGYGSWSGICTTSQLTTTPVMVTIESLTPGILDNPGVTICAGADPAAFGMSSLPVLNGPSNYSYQWYSTTGDVSAPTGSGIPAEWTPVGGSTNSTTPFVWLDDFEAGNSWDLGLGNFAVGAPGASNTVTTAYSGTNVLGTVLNGNYLANCTEGTNFAISPTIDLTGVTNPVLKFWTDSRFRTSTSTSTGDGGRVYVSTDNGATWSANLLSTYYEGSYQQRTITLPAAAANNPSVRIRFTMYSNSSTNYTGYNIDDVSIEGTIINPPPSLDPPVTNSGTATTTYALYITSNGVCPLNTWAVSEYTVTIDPCPLPIELISFTGQCQNRVKQFNWSTASEHNNEFFTLEHSHDGSEFYPIQEIDGAGNSSSQLDYITYFTEEDNSFVYYRLKQTDTDGATSYSDVIYVSCREFESDLMTVFPNPSNDLIVVNFNSSISEDDYLISITDMVGKSVLDRHIAAVKNGNTVLDVSSFSNGYYFLRLIDKNTGEQLDVVRFSKID